MFSDYSFTVADRFMKYVKVDTQSDPHSTSFPSTERQKDLSRILVTELQALGIHDALLDDHGYVFATIPSNTNKKVPVICFCAHVDTSADSSGRDVKPILHKGFDGKPIILPDDPSVVITTEQHAYLKEKIGDDIITASGTTLLGADDKAGVAVIMDMVTYLVQHPEYKHGKIRILFTPDEEVGRGVEKLDMSVLGAEYGYTLDGSELGSLEDETFSADGMQVTFYGISAHPGYAKDKLVNAIKIASDFITSLPADKFSPETTEGRQGFVHPVHMEGTAEKAVVEFIVRDFKTEKLMEHENFICRLAVYVPMLKNKKVGVFANQTSMVGNTHLVDTLRKLGVNITVIFGPEHGFRGTADAGEKVGNYTDDQTGVPVISLYGSKRRPSAEDLANVDIMIFDIQDVGARFYTYISSLQEYMESALQNSKPLLILDRPNPNGFYVDGPVLEAPYRSFIGMQPVPVVYGMTMGEYAMMLAGERWLSDKANAKYDYYRTAENSRDTPFHFLVIKCGNYTHQSKYELPVKTSPNLPDMASVYWYPSTCFFEGTALSEGRGTPTPFQVFGHPTLPNNLYAFTPVSTDGAKEPKLKNQLCYGWNLSGSKEEVLKKVDGRIQLGYLINAYKLFPEKEKFFLLPKSGKKEDSFFNKLAGNSTLMEQIIAGKSEAEIRQSWEPGLTKFKAVRKKYLMYAD